MSTGNKKDSREKIKRKQDVANEVSKVISEDNDQQEIEDTSKEAELFEDSPAEMKRFMRTITSIQGVVGGSMFPSISSKVTEKHLDRILEIREKDNEREYQDAQQSRKFVFFYVLIGVALFVFLTLFLVAKDKDLFKEMIKLFITFVGGMGAGYGIKSYVSRE